MRPKTFILVFGACTLLAVLGGCSQKIALFNGQDLEGWYPVLAAPNMDPTEVWSVRDGVLRCEGKPNGYIRTTDVYSNYALHLEWRWPQDPTNSGVLLDITGEDKVWPKCIEAQLMYQNAGDFYAIGGTSFNELDGGTHLAKQHPTNETQPGEWNTYDIVCSGNTITLTVNGLMQNKATGTSVNAGHIGLQSEGSPIEFRNIILTPIQ